MAEDLQLQKIRRIAWSALSVIIAGLGVFFLLFRFDAVVSVISVVLDVLSPIIIGFVLAYIINSPMCFMENQCLKVYVKLKKTPSRRAMNIIHNTSAMVTLLVLLLLCYAMFALIVPELIFSIQNILSNVPTYANNIQTWYNGLVEKYAFDASTKVLLQSALTGGQTWIAEQFSPQFNGLLTHVTNGVLDGLILFKNVIIGVFVSIYVLISKDSILARARRIGYALFNAATANNIIKQAKFVDEKFGGFLIGKILDSLIIGVICYIALMIMGTPYALLVAVIVGLTNIIPFFGPFIGAVPSAILIGCVSPIQTVYFIIFIIILQQFDGSILGPKILGNSVGVSSFMVLVAILIGSGLFGFVGMVIAVPASAILVSIVQTYILRRLARKNLPGDIEAYHHIDHVDPISRAIVEESHASPSTNLYKRIQERSEATRGFYVPLEENPWDRRMEEVERERIQHEKDRDADRSYCKSIELKLNEKKLDEQCSELLHEKTDEAANSENAVVDNAPEIK